MATNQPRYNQRKGWCLERVEYATVMETSQVLEINIY